MTDLDKARQELAQAQDDFFATVNRQDHTMIEFAFASAKLKKAQRAYKDLNKGGGK